MLDDIHYRFIDAYLQTYSPEEAARKAGIPVAEALRAGIDMLKNKEIREALIERDKDFQESYNALPLTKERLVALMMFQYEKSLKMGRTKEAVDILAKIAEAQGIDFKGLKIDPINLIINNLNKDKI